MICIKLPAILLLGAILPFTACKKNDKTPVVTKAGITGTWILSSESYSPAIDYDGDGTKESEVIGLYDACDADDLLILRSDGTGESNEGATKCDPGDEQVIDTFTWELNEDNTLEIDYSGGNGSVKVLQADGSILKISQSMSIGSTTYTIISTYSKRM